MRRTFDEAERYRIARPTPGILPQMVTRHGDEYGMFVIARPNFNIRMIVDNGAESGWEHVSVSCKVQRGDGRIEDVTPPWETMAIAKLLFWEDEECVVQFHPPRSQYVNRTENVLHLWRRVGVDLETPPMQLV